MRQRREFTECDFAFRITMPLVRHEIRKPYPAMRPHFVVGQLAFLEKANEKGARDVQKIRSFLSRQFSVVRQV